MRSGPEHHEASEANESSAILSIAEQLGYGEEAKEWISKTEVWLSRGDEMEKQRHVEEFSGDPDSLDYAIDLADKNPTLLIEQLRNMESSVEDITEEQTQAIRDQLARTVKIGGDNMLADINASRDTYRQVSFELRGQNFSSRPEYEAWQKLNEGRSLRYEDLVKLGGVSEESQKSLYNEMDSGSQRRFAITFPARDFLSPDHLQGALDFYTNNLPDGMRGLADHPYTSNLLENPLKNPNLTPDQLDGVVADIYDIKCNPRNIEAYYNAARALRFVKGHPNCTDEIKADIQKYMDWMDKNGEQSES